jgi:hypothetical protein
MELKSATQIWFFNQRNSPETESQQYTYCSGLDFSLQMSNIEFMFTKNFNSKVSSTFKRDAASIITQIPTLMHEKR